MKPAIVVATFNRPEALARLLKSLVRAHMPPDVPLVISIDPGGNRESEVIDLAQRFKWPHGEKRVIHHQTHLGVVKHFHFCGSLTEEYGSIVKLEDDYYISATYYDYASQALDFYKHDLRIAGISLYRVWFNGYTHQPFFPFPDRADVFFMQTPWSQGQAYTRTQWHANDSWRTEADPSVIADDPIHEVYQSFGPDDWFPLKTKYLATTNRFYVFPYQSLSTNFGETGTHFNESSSYFQVPLQSLKREYCFQPLDEATAVYDSFQEILPDRLNRHTDQLVGYDYEVDLSGTKSVAKIHHPYVLTIKLCRNPILSFGSLMLPREMNVVEEIPGNDICLCHRKDLRLDWLSQWRTRQRNYALSMQRYDISNRIRIWFYLLAFLNKLDTSRLKQ